MAVIRWRNRTRAWRASVSTAALVFLAIALPRSASGYAQEEPPFVSAFREEVARKQESAFPLIGSGYTAFIPSPATDLLGGLPVNEAEGTATGFDFNIGTPGVELAWFYGRPGPPQQDVLPTGCTADQDACGGFDQYGFFEERFTGLTVHGVDATVIHGTGMTAPEGWFISWYDPGLNTTYSFGVYERLAREVGLGLDPQNHTAAAQRLAAIADSLTEVTL